MDQRIDPRIDRDAQLAARRWFGLAVGSLIVAGLLSLLLVVARMPPFSAWIRDPLFFKRSLVVHVDLALVVWFYAFILCLLHTLPSRRSLSPLARYAPAAGFVGMLVIVAAAGASGAQPILSNYIPMIDHPLFLGGLLLFGQAVLAGVLQGRLLPAFEVPVGFFPLPDAARPGLRAAALALLVAALTFVASGLTTPRLLPAQSYYEFVVWGGGHVLQFASVAGMLSVWIILLTPLLGASPVSRRTATLLFGLLTLPLLVAPLWGLEGANTVAVHTRFTRLMEFGIFPVVTIFVVLCVAAIWRARREGRLRTAEVGSGPLVGFFVSAGLTVLGFALGAIISGSNTLIPAHYHASIGAVTAAFMTVTYRLLGHLGMPLEGRRVQRLATWQPLLFGVGQFVFACGFALAGAQGMLRKTYGSEQQIRGALDYLGLAVMGVGGLVAVVGGLLFLGLVTLAWRRRATAARAPLFAHRLQGDTHGK